VFEGDRLGEEWDSAGGLQQKDPIEFVAEVGGSEAVKITADLFAPGSTFTVSPPSKDNMKFMIAWWDDLITQWFAVNNEEK